MVSLWAHLLLTFIKGCRASTGSNVDWNMFFGVWQGVRWSGEMVLDEVWHILPTCTLISRANWLWTVQSLSLLSLFSGCGKGFSGTGTFTQSYLAALLSSFFLGLFPSNPTFSTPVPSYWRVYSTDCVLPILHVLFRKWDILVPLFLVLYSCTILYMIGLHIRVWYCTHASKLVWVVIIHVYGTVLRNYS